MISRKQYNLAAGTYVISDLLRAAFLVIPALITHSLAWALIGSVAFFVLRVCATAGLAEVSSPLQVGSGLRALSLKLILYRPAANWIYAYYQRSTTGNPLWIIPEYNGNEDLRHGNASTYSS